MADSQVTVPAPQGNQPTVAIVMQAMQWGMNPYAVAQKHTVNGVLGYEAQLVNAVIAAPVPFMAVFVPLWG